MARTAAVSDEKIVRTLARRKKPYTAAQLSEKLGAPISTTRLNQIAGVEVVGNVPSEGKRGRPARLFTATGPETQGAADDDGGEDVGAC